MQKETEIKLRVSRETLAALREHPLLKKRNKSGWERRELMNQYFDTPVFEETARMIPNARLKLWEGEAHMLPIEKRGEVAIAVAAFLAEGQR